MKLPASVLATLALAGCGPIYERRTAPEPQVEVEIEQVEIEPVEIEPASVRHFAQPPPSTPPPPQQHVIDDCPGCGMG